MAYWSTVRRRMPYPVNLAKCVLGLVTLVLVLIFVFTVGPCSPTLALHAVCWVLCARKLLLLLLLRPYQVITVTSSRITRDNAAVCSWISRATLCRRSTMVSRHRLFVGAFNSFASPHGEEQRGTATPNHLIDRFHVSRKSVPWGYIYIYIGWNVQVSVTFDFYNVHEYYHSRPNGDKESKMSPNRTLPIDLPVSETSIESPGGCLDLKTKFLSAKMIT